MCVAKIRNQAKSKDGTIAVLRTSNVYESLCAISISVLWFSVQDPERDPVPSYMQRCTEEELAELKRLSDKQVAEEDAVRQKTGTAGL